MACTPRNLKKFSIAAKNEIGETRVNFPEAVLAVKQILVEKYPDLRFPPEIDEIVKRCLRTCKFDFVRAATHLHSFFKYLFDCRTLHGEMYFVPSILKEYFFDSFGYCVLKNRDSKGRMVLLIRMERLPSQTLNLDKAVATNIMILDEMSRCSVETQRLGVVIIADFYGYDFGHAKQFTLSRISTCAKMVQGSIPICIHSHDLARFHEDVSPDILPEYLGGKMPDNKYADLEFNNNLFDKDEYYKELFRFGYFTSDENE